MITREQVRMMARRDGVPLHVVEMDYVQCLYLRELFEIDSKAIFKGGTALRHIHGLDRYSEDLDFNHPDNRDELISIVQQAAKRLKRYGISAENKDIRWSTTGVGFNLSFKGPLYGGSPPSKGKIRIDVITREEISASEKALVKTSYADIPYFWVHVLTLEELAAEKFRALLIRQKPRDLFDIWYLYNKGTIPSISLVNRKLAQYSVSLSRMDIEEILEKAARQWNHDMGMLLRQKPPLDIVLEDVKKMYVQMQAQDC